MRTSLLKGAYKAPKIGSSVRRSTLGMYDLFRPTSGGSIYMHTGWRTRPPSGGDVSVSVAGNTTKIPINKVLFKDDAGKEVIGFQSIKVVGGLDEGDGAVISFKDNFVTYLGVAEVTLPNTAV